MLTFRTDAANFADGDRDGVRIATGAGLAVDFDEFAADAATLGLWHLHDGGCQGEGSGLADASGGGHDLANAGASPVEDGYRFVAAENDYMTATLGALAQPQAAVTLEGWVRQWQTPAGQYGQIARCYVDGNNRLMLDARRGSTPADSYIGTSLKIGGAWSPTASWSGAAADALLASAEPWHVAAVLDAPGSLRLFVNGTKRAETTPVGNALPAGTYQFILGYGSAAAAPSAVIDEARVSASARYAADFTPHRLLAAGTYAGPTFDADRLLAAWLDLVAELQVPPGCAAAWEARAADALDGFGRPQALWQTWDGTPGALPAGRFFQWRVTLSASADWRATPLVETVDAVASEAGYNVYHATGDGPEALDYAEPLARVGPGLTAVETPALQAGAVHWFAVRPVDALGRETPLAQDEVRLETDSQGGRVADRPAGVLSASASPLPQGAAEVEWRYRVGAGGVRPVAFRVFGDGGTGTIDYGTPLGEVPYRAGQMWYAWTSGPLPGGGEHLLAIRAVSAAGPWDEQPAVVAVTVDAAPPDEVDLLEAETTL
ncbi:MAG: hypothetical protein IMZ66_09690 [Planctomycetes bacterium]|nr:hypothetical protein [Planctomycetota bacterium]